MSEPSEFRARSLGCGGWTIRCRWNEEPRFTAILHTPTRKFVGTGESEEEACKAALVELAQAAAVVRATSSSSSSS